MRSPGTVLFETKFNDKPLFSSQLDLVNALLNNKQTKYYVAETELEQYTKAQNRLKSYISQLLSSSVSKSITEDFKTGLTIIIESRLKGGDLEVSLLVNEILDSIREKNSIIAKSENKPAFADQFATDLNSANYIAIITSRPLEIEAPERIGLPTLRNLLFSDLITRLYDKDKDLKYYRFNFPIETFGSLFWRGLKRILVRHFKSNPSHELFQSLYQKFAIESDTFFSITNVEKLSDDHVERIVDETLLRLNRNRYILVFTTMAPVYGLPVIAMDPSDNKNCKVYSILESDKMTLFKFPDNETLLWRLFFWDALKSKRYSGEPVTYSNEAV